MGGKSGYRNGILRVAFRGLVTVSSMNIQRATKIAFALFYIGATLTSICLLVFSPPDSRAMRKFLTVVAYGFGLPLVIVTLWGIVEWVQKRKH